MGANDVRAGGAFIEVFLKDKTRAQFNAMASKWQGYAATLGGAFAIASGIEIGAVTAFATATDTIADSAGRLGIGTKALHGYAYAASQTGASLEDVENGLKIMERLLGQAANGTEAAQKKLAKYGIDWQSLAESSPEEQMRAFADAIARQPTQSTKAAAAMELLGKGGLKLLPMLSNGAAGLDAFGTQAEKLGLVMKDSDIAAGGKLADIFSTLGQQARMVANMVGAALAPSFQFLAEVLRGVLAWTIGFVDRNRVLVSTLTYVTGGLLIAATAAMAVGLAYRALSLLSWMVSAAQLGVWLATSLVNSVYYAGAFAANAYAMAQLFLAGASAAVSAAMMNPVTVGLLLASVLLSSAVAALYFAGVFNGLSAIVSQSMKGVFDAIMGGNLQLAFEILSIGVSLTWVTMLGNMERELLKFVSAMATTLGALATGFAAEFGVGAKFAAQVRAVTGAVAQGNAARMNVLDAQEATLKTALDAKNAQAAKEREAMDGGGLFQVPNLQAMFRRLPNFGGMGGEASRAFSTGTFSSSAAGLIGRTGQAIAEKQLKVQERMAEDMAAMRKEIENMEGIPAV